MLSPQTLYVVLMNVLSGSLAFCLALRIAVSAYNRLSSQSVDDPSYGEAAACGFRIAFWAGVVTVMVGSLGTALLLGTKSDFDHAKWLSEQPAVLVELAFVALLFVLLWVSSSRIAIMFNLDRTPSVLIGATCLVLVPFFHLPILEALHKLLVACGFDRLVSSM